jgi:hypothetical protein
MLIQAIKQSRRWLVPVAIVLTLAEGDTHFPGTGTTNQ